MQPFFPPLLPIQSINLRAAIFKYLNELKKDGILRKDVVIRKTMLDECKGEKLEDLLAAFSTVVLQKVLNAEHNVKPSRVRKLALAHTLSGEEQQSLLPLAIAHRASLEGLLRKRAQLRTKYLKFQHVLDVKEQELLARTASLELARKDSEEGVVPNGNIGGLRKQFGIHWQGDPRWIDAIFEGESETQDPLLDTPFSEVWAKVTRGTVDPDSPQQQGLLQQLDSRVAVQEARLRKWRRFREDLAFMTKSAPRVKSPGDGQRPGQGLDLDFSRHTDLTLKPADIAQTSLHDQPRRESEPEMVDEYERLMKSMRRELIKVDEVKPSQDHSEDCALKRENVEPNELPQHLRKVPTPAKIEKVSQADLEVEHARGLPRTRPKRSPIRVNRSERDRNRPPNGSSTLAPNSKTYSDQDHPLSENPSTSSDSKLSQMNQSGGSTSDMDEEEMLAQQIILSTTSALSPRKAKPSLSERTRKSMALTSPGEIFQMPVAESFPKPKSPDVFASSSSTALNSRETLLERTRQSMSLLPPKPRKQVIDKRRTSKVYPTNQFGSPEQSYNTSSAEAMTPPEALFAQDVNYASVFKSRPKVATSPTPSPMPNRHGGLVNIMEGQVEEEEVGNGWEGSPLARTANTVE